MNKYALGTIAGTVLLGLSRLTSLSLGSKTRLKKGKICTGEVPILIKPIKKCTNVDNLLENLEKLQEVNRIKGAVQYINYRFMYPEKFTREINEHGYPEINIAIMISIALVDNMISFRERTYVLTDQEEEQCKKLIEDAANKELSQYGFEVSKIFIRSAIFELIKNHSSTCKDGIVIEHGDTWVPYEQLQLRTPKLRIR